MYEELMEDLIVQKCGGRFRLTTLIQKRLVALNRGARPLVDLVTKDHMAIVIAEIMQDKIYLDTSTDLAVSEDGTSAPVEVVKGDGGPSLDDLT